MTDGPGSVPFALYDGTVRHQRPGGHGFHQRVRMVHADVDRLDDLCALHPLWSDRRRAPVEFRREDYLDAGEETLAAAVRSRVAGRSGDTPRGPVSILTFPRTWGWLFNPITCYFCWSTDGTEVEAAVFEVTNTPWHERTTYVVGAPGRHDLAKTMHVSPFLPPTLTYRVRYRAPAQTWALSFSVRDADDTVHLEASVVAHRVPVDGRSLGSVVWQPWRGTIGVSAGIYRQAAALRLKGATVHPHPGRPGIEPVEVGHG